LNSSSADGPGEPSRRGIGTRGQSSAIRQDVSCLRLVRGRKTCEVPTAPIRVSTVCVREQPESCSDASIGTWQCVWGVPSTSGQKQKPLTVEYLPKNSPVVSWPIVGCA
jgi:hypothetical protein